jgi:hypothetical protein
MDSQYESIEDKSFEDIVACIRGMTESQRKEESSLIKLIKMVHMCLSVVDVVVDKKWYYIYECIDKNVPIEKSFQQDSLFAKYILRTKDIIAQIKEDPMVADQLLVDRLETLRAEFASDYNDLTKTEVS